MQNKFYLIRPTLIMRVQALVMLSFLIQTSCAQLVDEPSKYMFTDISFALIYNGTGLTRLENITKAYITGRGGENFVQLPPSTPVDTLLTYDVVLMAGPYLNSSTIDEIEDKNGSIILMHAALTAINASRWGSAQIINSTNLVNQSYRIIQDAGPTRGYPQTSSFMITETNLYRLNGTIGNANLVNLNETSTVVASKQAGTGKTALIGFNLTTHHEQRMLDKAIYWMYGRTPTVHQNSRYCLYDCVEPTECRPCSDVVVLVDDPARVTPQENASYSYIYTQHGNIIHKIEYSEFTLANLTPVNLFIVPSENKITSQINSLRAQNKSFLFVHNGVLEAETQNFNGTATGLVNVSEIPNGDAYILQNRPGEITYGYPSRAHIYTQNQSLRVLAEVPGHTALVGTLNGTLLSYSNSTYKTIFYGFDPAASYQYSCSYMGYHSGVLYIRSVEWVLGMLNITVAPPKTVTSIVYNNNLYTMCGNTWTPQENSANNRLTSRYGSGSVTVLDLSLANATNYSTSSLIVSHSSERTSSMIGSWVSSQKSIMLLYEGAYDANTSLFNGTITTENSPGGLASIETNGQGEIAYGYPQDAVINTQNDSTRYLTSIPGFTSIATYGGLDLLSSKNSNPRMVVYGFDAYQADVDATPLCLGYHGWKLFDRSVDWLLNSLNVSAEPAKKIAIQFYGVNETWHCDTGQESVAYDRLDSKNYSQGNVSRVDLSVAAITDYSNTELVVVGSGLAVTSMIPAWRSTNKDLLFLLQGVVDAASYFGGSYSVDTTNETHANISRANVGEITDGYALEAYIYTDLSRERLTHTITGFTTLATNALGEGLLSYQKGTFANVVVYTFNLTEYSYPCTGYHGWKLFDRSVEWLLGILSVPHLDVGRVGVVVNMKLNDSRLCFSNEENSTYDRVLSLNNVSVEEINATPIEISELTTAFYFQAGAVVVTDSNVDGIGNYYENLLDGGTRYAEDVGVLMFQYGMDKVRRRYNKTPCNDSMHKGAIYGRIRTTNEQNRMGLRPPYGYPYNARVQVHGDDSSSCYWYSLPVGFVSFIGNDTSDYSQSIAVASSTAYSEKLVLLGWRPYDAWIRGSTDADNENYHGSVIFDRSLLWILGDDVVRERTKDIVLVVYNENNILGGEGAVLNWSNHSFGEPRFSVVDVSNLLFYDTCGASRFVSVTGDLISGIAGHWSDKKDGVVFVGESLYDAAKGLGASPVDGIDPLGDEYLPPPFPIYGKVLNNSFTGIFNLSLYDSRELTTDSADVYSVEITKLSSNYTVLAIHTNQTAGVDEVLLSVRNTSNSTGVVLFGINPSLATSFGGNWTLNSIEWSNPRDVEPPNVTVILITPYSYSLGDEIVFNVNVVDDRNWSVYSVTVNYTLNNTYWNLFNLSRIVDSDSYTCTPDLSMDVWNGSLGSFNASFIVYSIISQDTSGNVNSSPLNYYGVLDVTPPQIVNIDFRPYMPNASDDVTVYWNTDEFSNATLYYRTRNSSDAWTVLKDSSFRVFNHTVNTGTHNQSTQYEYFIESCDLSGNCGNETNGGDYFWFCIEPGCDKNVTRILNHTPENITIFPPNSTNFTLIIETDEWAECKYSTTAGKSFDAMEYLFNETHNTTHVGYMMLQNSSNYYIRCKDMLGNRQDSDYRLYYWIDWTPPTITLNSPGNGATIAGSLLDSKFTPNDNGQISRCSVYTDFESWGVKASSTKISKGQENTLSSRLCDGTFRWNIQCWDSVNNTAFASANFTVTINSTRPILIIDNGEGELGGQLNWPEGISVFGDVIYVADTYNHRIEKYNRESGSYFDRIGGPLPGTGMYNFYYPEAISAGINTSYNGSEWINTTYIYVADTQNMRIQIFFDTNGTFLKNLTDFDDPSGIEAVGERLFISDTDNNRIKVINSSNLSIERVFSGGVLNNPQGLTSDGSQIYIANRQSNNIVIFDVYGTYLGTIGSYGSSDGQFNSPDDVAVDSLGNIYVADTLNNRIQVFNSTRSHMLSLGSYGVLGSEFQHPKGVAVDYEDKVYVADTENSRIQVFSLCYVSTTTSTTSTTTTSTTSSTTTTTSTTSTTTTSSTSTTSILRAEVVLNEIMPHPVLGGEDWVELYNRGNVEVSLVGWVIDDVEGGSSNYTIASGVIPVGGFVVFNYSQISVNFDSTGDDVRLFNGTGSLVDNLTWSEDPGESVSWMRSPDGWGGWIKSSAENPPSPGESNGGSFEEPLYTGWNLISLPLVF